MSLVSDGSAEVDQSLVGILRIELSLKRNRNLWKELKQGSDMDRLGI